MSPLTVLVESYYNVSKCVNNARVRAFSRARAQIHTCKIVFNQFRNYLIAKKM